MAPPQPEPEAAPIAGVVVTDADAPRSPTTPGSAPGGSAPSSGSSTPRCVSSARRATTSAASPGSPSSPAARASFYQYFSGKEDVFRHLAGQVARQLERVDRGARPRHARRRRLAVDPGLGRPLRRRLRALRAGLPGVPDRGRERRRGRRRLGAHGRAARRRLPVPADGDDPAAPPARPGDRAPARVHPPGPSTSPASCARPPSGYPRSGSRTPWPTSCTARCSGSRPSTCTPRPPPAAGARVQPRHAGGPRPRRRGARPDARRPRTLQALMDAGRELFVARGYHDTRINDVVAAAGLSKGRSTATSRARTASSRSSPCRPSAPCRRPWPTSPAAAPDGAAARRPSGAGSGGTTPRRPGEAAMIRVWADAAAEDATFRSDSAAALDWGRRRLAHFLRPRGFGDVDSEAVVAVALLGTFGARERPAAAHRRRRPHHRARAPRPVAAPGRFGHSGIWSNISVTTEEGMATCEPWSWALRAGWGVASGSGWPSAAPRWRCSPGAGRLDDAAKEAGPGTLVVECDVTDGESCRSAVAEAAAGLGGIDALVYAPGIGPLVKLVDTDAETWRRVFDTNVTGAALVTAAAVPHLAASAAPPCTCRRSARRRRHRGPAWVPTPSARRPSTSWSRPGGPSTPTSASPAWSSATAPVARATP